MMVLRGNSNNAMLRHLRNADIKLKVLSKN